MKYQTSIIRVAKIAIFLNIIFSIQHGYAQSELNCQYILAESMMNISYRHSTSMQKEGDEIKSYGKYNIDVKVEETAKECEWKIIIKNLADQPFYIHSNGGTLPIICEAKNSIGLWKPIEFQPFSWCAVGAFTFELEPTAFIEIYRTKYSGNFATKVRFKVQLGNFVLYSNPINARINKRQFKKRSW